MNINASFLEYFDKQALEVPNNIALDDGIRQLSYSQLYHLSEQFAKNMVAADFLVGDVVGVWMPRNVDLWVVILGLFKAGCVYLPLDNEWPEDRLSYIVEKSGSGKIICGERPLSVFEKAKTYSYNDLCGDAGVALASIERNVDATAYIIFTSGSTGRPKGVMVSHSNLAGLLTAMAQRLQLNESDCQLCITSLSFDLVIPDLFLPLVVGACCYLAPTKFAADAGSLSALIKKRGITILQATPHTYKRLLANAWQGAPNLKALIGGEAVSSLLADNLGGKVKELWHCYGPTEATVWSTMARYKLGGDLLLSPALAGYEVLALDAHGQSLLKGEEGELYIGGIGVAKGYINDQAATSEAFLTLNVEGTNRRFYKTGDFVISTGEGGYKFAGRKDNQLKISGYRVELAEIEELGARIPGVEDCVAVADGEDRIAFYYTKAKDKEAGVVEGSLRDRLFMSLPWYMMPAHLLCVDEIPLTINGKVDRKLLSSLIDNKVNVAAGQSPLYEKIKEVWEEIFPKREILADDNFFDLGGDSLCAVQLLTKVESSLGYDLPLSCLYAYPTVALLSAKLQADGNKGLQLSGAFSDQMICLQQGDKPPLYCFHPLGGNVFQYRLLAKCLGEERAVYGVQPVGMDGAPPIRNIQAMAAYYVQCLESVHKGGEFLLAGGSMGGVLALEVARQLLNKGQKVNAVFMFDTMGPGELKRAPVVSKVLEQLKTARAFIKNAPLLIRARAYLLGGKRLPNSLRYRYIEWVNYWALEHYFSQPLSREAYHGQVVLIRQPLQSSGIYADESLGWGKVVKEELLIGYVDAPHDKFIEADDFETLFTKLFAEVVA